MMNSDQYFCPSKTELLLNFTAIEFVSLIDNAAFVLAAKGFLGIENKKECNLVLETEYPVPESRKHNPRYQVFTLFVLYFILLGGWAAIFSEQVQGKNSIRIFAP